MAIYCRMTSLPADLSVNKLVPKRTKTRGLEPGIAEEESRGAVNGSKQWTFPQINPSEKQYQWLPK